eukprot:m.883735 g.883735  ORF g.883735 m.883735 type:complete len:77 (-) comp23612_c0_seq1:2151-2381(-)
MRHTKSASSLFYENQRVIPTTTALQSFNDHRPFKTLTCNTNITMQTTVQDRLTVNDATQHTGTTNSAHGMCVHGYK